MPGRSQRGRAFIAVGLGYLLGTFPTARLVAARVSSGRTDLRRTGSGNPGSANAYAVLGTGPGAAVLAGDIGKGLLACGVGGLVAGPTGAHLGGTAAVAGHCYPIWDGFRGGKGVATSVGQCLATFPAYFPIDITVAVATAATRHGKQRAFAATAVSSICWVAGAAIWAGRDWPNAWGPKPSKLLPLAALASSSMILQRFISASR